MSCFTRRSTFIVAVILVVLTVFIFSIDVNHIHDWTLSHVMTLRTGSFGDNSTSSPSGRMINAVLHDSINIGLSEPAYINIPGLTKLMGPAVIPRRNITYSGPFMNSTKGNILNQDPPVFLPEFKNPCWYEMPGLTDLQRRQLEDICFRKVGAKSKMCDFYSKQKPLLCCLPYFMLIGMPKSGSTDLYKRIIDHEDVIGGKHKEPHWWTRKQHYRKGFSFTKYVNHYSSFAHTLQFSEDDRKSTLITGEGSQSTLWDNTWWWRYPENHNDEEPGLLTANFIRHILPEVKLLVILRNPVDRLYSDYLFFKKGNLSAADFHKRVTNQVNTFNRCLTEHSIRHCAYLQSRKEVRLHIGLYALYLKEWMDIFPRDQFLVLQLEEYSAHTQKTMSAVYKFLKLRVFSDEYGNKSPHSNTMKKASLSAGQMLNETRVLLETFYKPYNKALALLMNDTLFLWETSTRA